jgi:ribonucleoside-triphosphate reductase
VIEGMFSIQKDHCKVNRLPWNDHKAQRTAQDAYERMFTFKWTPPGRGLWMMGTPLVNRDKNSAALQNCAFVSTNDMTKTDPSAPFTFLMEASMLGIGVGFDDKGADKGFKIYTPGYNGHEETYVIPDSREGWVESVKLILESYWMPNKPRYNFDYSLIRPAGEPIKTFGGTAAGPDHLIRLHLRIAKLFDGRGGQTVTRRDIADVGNQIGCCVVSGNVRRSAELLIGHIDDKEFVNLKNPQWFPERNFWQEGADPDILGWGHMSNNSVEAKVGDNYDHLVDSIALNGEPGIVWMDVSRQFGRLIDPLNNKDWRVAGYNPCAEQSLESFECCTLVETYLNRNTDLEDFKRTLKVAYLYAKTVTLLPTHWQRTNAIMQRNRRIGCSMSGMANFADTNGMTALRTWMNDGYASVCEYDRIYSEWLGIRESIKKTTVKPSGTVSILAGESPGAHWAPGGKLYFRTIRFSSADPMVKLFREAGYRIEPDVKEPDVTAVVYFPIRTDAERAEDEVSIFEKANLAVLAQRYWSDNSVSVTVSFDPEREGKQIGTVLHMHEGQLKTVSFLPSYKGVYPQMPYSSIGEEDYENAEMTLYRVDLNAVYNGTANALDAVGEAYCTTSVCEIKEIVNS